MTLKKYFKTEQKLVLKPLLDAGGEQTNVEHLSTFLIDVRNGYCDLRLPYGKTIAEQFPFENEMPVELLGDSFGLGIKVLGHFDRFLDGDTIRIKTLSDLKIFQRRLHPRHERIIGIRYTKGRGTLRSYRAQWKKNIDLLEKSVDLSKLKNFPRSQANISPSGIRIPVKPPIAEADLCLLLIELVEQTPPICALAEVVWIGSLDDSEQLVAGMQFINIRKSDQLRIASFLNQKL
jgi:PilZ domain